MLRSLKGVYKAPAVGPWLGLGPSPDPGLGAGVELGGGHLGGVGDLVGVGEVLPGQRVAPEDPPPALLHVQPAGALGDEGVWVPRTSSTSRDQAILVDQATDASMPPDAVLLKIDRFG